VAAVITGAAAAAGKISKSKDAEVKVAKEVIKVCKPYMTHIHNLQSVIFMHA
jgi:hypothetical protein